MSTVRSRWQARLVTRLALLAYAERQFRYWRDRWADAKKWNLSSTERSRRWQLMEDRAEKVRRRRRQVEEARRVIARHTPQPLRLQAFWHASRLVGVMEQGGNNMGPVVTEIIRANEGTGPEPWCGDFVAFVYRKAGSKAVTRSWAAVRLLAGVAGIRRTSSPQKGDLVRFTFSHVGLFEKDNGDGTITTIEGNTGASGAVSDSRTGGDGVYRKVRSKNLVLDYLEVTR